MQCIWNENNKKLFAPKHIHHVQLYMFHFKSNLYSFLSMEMILNCYFASMKFAYIRNILISGGYNYCFLFVYHRLWIFFLYQIVVLFFFSLGNFNWFGTTHFFLNLSHEWSEFSFSHNLQIQIKYYCIHFSQLK